LWTEFRSDQSARNPTIGRAQTSNGSQPTDVFWALPEGRAPAAAPPDYFRLAAQRRHAILTGADALYAAPGKAV
jgi:hypothetical protein